MWGDLAGKRGEPEASKESPASNIVVVRRALVSCVARGVW